MNKKNIKAKVIKLKNLKTATVEISSLYLHPKYLKPIKKTSKLQVHNDSLPLEVGDEVIIEKSKTYSATKHFVIVRKVVLSPKKS